MLIQFKSNKTVALLRNSTEKSSTGFGLIEVLIALAIVSIALIALIFSLSQEVKYTQAIKDKLISHWLCIEALNLSKLGVINPGNTMPTTIKKSFLGESWYIQISKLSIQDNLNTIVVKSSHNETGPFQNAIQSLQTK